MKLAPIWAGEIATKYVACVGFQFATDRNHLQIYFVSQADEASALSLWGGELFQKGKWTTPTPTFKKKFTKWLIFNSCGEKG